MNKELQGLVVLAPHIFKQVYYDTAEQENIFESSTRRASRHFVRYVDMLSYFADESCEEPENAIKQRYGKKYVSFESTRMELLDSIEAIRTHRVITPLGSKLAVYAKWFADSVNDEPLDERYVGIIHALTAATV